MLRLRFFNIDLRQLRKLLGLIFQQLAIRLDVLLIDRKCLLRRIATRLKLISLRSKRVRLTTSSIKRRKLQVNL